MLGHLNSVSQILPVPACSPPTPLPAMRRLRAKGTCFEVVWEAGRAEEIFLVVASTLHLNYSVEMSEAPEALPIQVPP